MADAPNMQVWTGRAIFLGLCLFLIFVQLLPLDARPETVPWPDLLLLATLVWVARRPDYVPVLVIGVVFFLTDLLFQRPPGLWTALVLLATEAIRARALRLRSAPLVIEWGTIAGAILIITFAYRMVLLIALSPTPPLGLTLLQMIMTLLAYPVVALFAHYMFRVSRPAPGAVDSLGHRL